MRPPAAAPASAPAPLFYHHKVHPLALVSPGTLLLLTRLPFAPSRLYPLARTQDVDAGDGLRIVHVVGKKRDVRHCALLIQLKTVSREDTQKIKELSEALEEFQV
jgi:hypothetical protein